MVAWLLSASTALAFALAPQEPHEQHQHDPPSKPQLQHQGHQEPRHVGHAMKGALGPWPMNQEGGGTTWLPSASPHFSKMLERIGAYDLHLMGIANLGYVDAGGKRGDEDIFSNSMAMLQAQRDTGGGTLSLRLMVSADPLINGEQGVPNLFQTGETANGEPLVDRQHPHDLIAELAASFSKPVGGDRRAFIYAGLAGEPALGSSVFLHRPSGMENPEAPISHHWFDATHISFGVLTVGMTWGDRFKLDASAFNGREPDENRYDIDPIRFDSASARVTYNPNPNWSFSGAYGYLKEPEALEPGEDQHRVTASVSYSRPIASDTALAVALLFGRNITHHGETDTWNLEATYYARKDSYFLRYERAEKDEIANAPDGVYAIQKITLGTVRHLTERDGFDWGVGAYLGFFDFPSSLDPLYGERPLTWGVFLRLRPSAH